MKKILIILLCISFLPINVFAIETAKDVDITKNATSSILIEQSTKRVLYNKNAHNKQAVASLTKMMGLILIFESLNNGSLKKEEIITTSENAKNMGGTQIWLETGEKISVDDLIKGVVMASANDAMVALAERISGTEEAFVKKMNDKAKELGLKNTNFKNCTGLDEEGHYSSAYDMGMIALKLLEYDEALKYTSKYEDYIRKNTENKTWIINTNKLIRFYEGADGLKTGFTDDAGSCLAVTAKRNNLRLVAVTLGYKKSNIRNSETINLLDYGYNQYKAHVIYKKGAVVGKAVLDKGEDKEIDVILKEDAIVVDKKEAKPSKYSYDIKLDTVKLPVKKGDKLGTMYVKDDGETVQKIDLLANKDVKKMNIVKLYFRILKDQLIGV